MAGTEYSLGHDDPEVQRLLLQGRLYGDHTEHALRLAGLAPGMRVLDVGCGPGDVSMAAARIVGRDGSVTGVDAQQRILDLASRRAAERGFANVRFHSADIFSLTAEQPYDAVIGRLILMHLTDPVAAVRHLSGLVRPGGVVTFQDFEISAARTVPAVTLIDQLSEVVRRSFRGAGASTEMGSSLHRVFRDAGLAAPRMTMSGCIGPATDPDMTEFLVGVWRTMLPVAQRLGLDVTGLTDLDALPQRMRTEAGEAIVMLPPLVSAWSTV